MKQKEFNRLFPNADPRFFKPDYDGTMVYINDDGIVDDITSISFLDDEQKIKALRLPPLGQKWWASARDNPNTNFLTEWRRMYRYRKFDHDKLFPLDTPPGLSAQTIKSNSAIWGPQEWNRKKQQKIPIISLTSNTINIESFRIYVNDNTFFMLHEKLPWDLSNVTKIDFSDPKNEYCLSLKAMYVLSYLGGIGLENLMSENNLAKSLAHFYFYYHLRKMYNFRDFRRYDTTPVEDYPWTLYSWASHFVWYHPQVEYTASSLKRDDHDVISGIRIDKNKVYYKTRQSKRNVSRDYLRLLTKNNKGLTKLGQLLLQESCQAYVYCVLGAQAKTRWKIVGDSANSLQTQRVFQDLVSEVTKQDNVSTLIKSMRIAISDTRVRLDFCISPGLELLPSNMVYIKDTPGYNNILVVSTQQQKFGVNNNVNTTLKHTPLKHTTLKHTTLKHTPLKHTPLKHTASKISDTPISTPISTYHDAPSSTASNTGIVLIGLLLSTPLLLLLL